MFSSNRKIPTSTNLVYSWMSIHWLYNEKNNLIIFSHLDVNLLTSSCYMEKHLPHTGLQDTAEQIQPTLLDNRETIKVFSNICKQQSIYIEYIIYVYVLPFILMWNSPSRFSSSLSNVLMFWKTRKDKTITQTALCLSTTTTTVIKVLSTDSDKRKQQLTLGTCAPISQ